MGAASTESVLCKRGFRFSTGRDSLGRRYEELAVRRLRKQGYAVLARNMRLSIGEVDILAQDSRGIVLVEVRGRKRTEFAPALTLSFRKKARLKMLQKFLAAKYRESVHIELWEVIGNPIFPVCLRKMRVRIYRVEF